MLFAATVICGACLFTSCKKDEETGNSDLRVAEKIIGKWVTADVDGQPLPTNEKKVITFVSTTKAYISAAFNANPEIGAHWLNKMEVAVAIDGNNVTVTSHPDEHTTTVEELTVTAINDSELTANRKLTATVDGNIVDTKEETVRYVKTTADYSAAILGLWECQGITGGETNNDDNARLEFLADGTYRFYRRNDAGVWNLVPRQTNEYFVDGNLLCTRWQAEGEEMSYEWWEIATAADGHMQWTALRQQADGSTFQQGVSWSAAEARTVLAGMDVDGLYSYGDATYTFTYDDQLRLTHILEVVPADNNLVARDITVTYSAGQVIFSGFIEGSTETDVCTLDAQGRIVEVAHTYIDSASGGGLDTSFSTFTFAYDADGHLLTQTRNGLVTTFEWQDGDIVRLVVGTEDNGYTVELTPSDAPAQGCFNLFGYDLDLSFLCPQGLFGVPPLHMPATRVITIIMGGNPVHSTTFNHTYTVSDGRLATVDDNYTFHWGLRKK